MYVSLIRMLYVGPPLVEKKSSLEDGFAPARCVLVNHHIPCEVFLRPIFLARATNKPKMEQTCHVFGLAFCPELLARFSAFFGVDLATSLCVRKLKPRSFLGG